MSSSQFPQLINGNNINLIGLLKGLNMEVCYSARPDTIQRTIAIIIGPKCPCSLDRPLYIQQHMAMRQISWDKDSVGMEPIHPRVRPLTLILLALCPA